MSNTKYKIIFNMKNKMVKQINRNKREYVYK